jgi:hypothetical protein
MSEVPAAAVEAATHAVHAELDSFDCPRIAEAALAAAAPLIRRATADEIAAALTTEAERAGGPIFTKALEHAAEIVDRVGGGGGGGQ